MNVSASQSLRLQQDAVDFAASPPEATRGKGVSRILSLKDTPRAAQCPKSVP